MKSVISKVFVGIGLLAVTGCTKEKASPGQPVTPNHAVDVNVGGISGGPPAVANNADVYFSGAIGNNAAYWKNDTAVTLGDGKHISEAYTIAVNGSNVYAAGVTYFTNYPVATFWTNGKETNAPTGTQSGVLNIALDGNDVYACGYYYNSIQVPEAVYWKNGVMVKLAVDTTRFSMTYSIAVNGGHVYVAGTIVNAPNQSQAVVWKDNAVFFSDTHPTNSEAYAIAFNGPDMYVTGTVGGSGVYWKNGIATTMPGTDSYALAIGFSGNDVYFAGVTQTNVSSPASVIPAMWKNNVYAKLTTATNTGYVYSMAINGPDVYIAGNDGTTHEGYWKNGVFHAINGFMGDAVGIFVVPK